jgi:hypothetical protein
MLNVNTGVMDSGLAPSGAPRNDGVYALLRNSGIAGAGSASGFLGAWS